MYTSFKHLNGCLGWQANPFPASLTSPVALKQQIGALEREGLATEDAGEGPSRWLPRMSRSAPHITTASAKKKKEGNHHRRFPSAGNRGPDMLIRPIPQGSLLPPWDPS